MSTSRTPPTWYSPAKEEANNQGKDSLSSLKVYNTLTKTKVPFVPQNDLHLKWYNCGPTVYDAAHMGHARNYVSVDVIRRILSDYFGYHIKFVMNITDIDDKIIIRARQNHLFNEFITLGKADINEDLINKIQTALEQFMADKFQTQEITEAESKASLADADPKLAMHCAAAKSTQEAIVDLKAKIAFGGSVEEQVIVEALEKTRDVMGPYLDKEKGAEVTDPKIFRELAAYWEKDFLGDMDALNVLPADVLTRVSEYVPEVVSFVEKIVANGYGYEVDGSVYFDTTAFDAHPDHYYAKLEPNSANNLALIEDGEGSLGAKLTGKKNPSDFALWKKSKAGEPSWDSPWGKGRPGWHIECSAMASEVLGTTMDIHSGGEDLAFPHHDNELAQSEAHHGCKQWVNYFFHVGHLHISGQKMSKSLKNFITIKEALQKYSARQLRLTFLMHQWDNGMDFRDSSMEEAIATEKLLNNFLVNAKALIYESRANPPAFTGAHQYHDEEKTLIAFFEEKQTAIHNAFCDSFNTPTVIRELSETVNRVNVYIGARRPTGLSPNTDVIGKIAKYITRIVSILGLTDRGQDIGLGASNQTGGNTEEVVMPYLHAMSNFRDQIRAIARGNGDIKEILAACDRLRDNDLTELGVLLDDREDGKALVKLVDREELIRERDIKIKREEEKRAKKEAAAKAQQLKQQERLAKGKTAPQDLFKNDPEFSKWDEEGVPTHTASGEEVAKSRRKKLIKDIEVQKKLHAEYLASQS